MIKSALTCRLLVIGAFSCLSALTPGHAMSRENTPPRYYLSVNTSGLPALIRINGVPLIKDTAAEGLVTTEPVHAWLMKGENTLGIELRTPPDKDAKAAADIKLYLHDPEAEVPTPQAVLAEFRYSNPTPLPLTQDIAFSVPEPLPTRLWDEAEALTELSANDKNQILDLVNRLQDSLLNQDIAAALRLQDYKITDDARAEGKPVERMREGVTLSLQWLAEQGELSGEPLEGASAAFELCANNRLVYVSRQDGEEAVTIESDELYFDVPVYAARIKGEWRIVR